MDPEITIDRTFYDDADAEFSDVVVEFRVADYGNKIIRVGIDGAYMTRAEFVARFGEAVARRIETSDSTFEAIERALKERCE